MSIPLDHHFVPAFYLRQWCNSGGKVIEYSIKNKKLVSKLVGPEATGYETALYAFPELPPEQAQHIEQRFFDYADRVAAEALRIQLTSPKISWMPEHRSAWSRFVVGLHLRHPDAMPELRAAAKSIWEGSGESSQQEYERIKEPSDPPTFDQYIEATDPLVPVKARMNLIVKAIDNPIVGTHINNMSWDVLDLSSSSRSLLTSDRPVGFFAIKSPKGMISLPLSPTKLFIAVNDPKLIDVLRKKNPREIVGHANEHLTIRARRFVWAAGPSQANFIQKKMSTQLEPLPLFKNLGTYNTQRT